MKACSCIAAILLLLFAGNVNAAAPMQWKLIRQGKGGSYEFLPRDNAFSLKLKRLPGKERSAAVAVTNVNTKRPSQDKLLFSCREINGNPVKVTLILSFQDGTKVRAPFGPAFTVAGTGWKHYTFSLDRDFRLGDALFEFRQLKFVANITSAPAGMECGIEVRDVRFCSPEEVSFLGGKTELTVEPDIKNVWKPSKDALKIYFHLDNEDYNRRFRNRRQIRAIDDRVQYAGFREMLLDSVRRQTAIAESPEQADVIVYSSTSPDPETAAEIVRAVRERGIPLFAASEVSDPEIAALLPVTIRDRERKGLPERRTLSADHVFALPDGKSLSTAAFGIYRSLTLRSGGEVLLKFSDGAPAVAEGRCGRGKTVYSTFTLGSCVIPDPDAYDRFFLSMLSRLSGRELSPASPLRQTVGDGWLPGAGEENFGRFGIRLGDGLLTESLTDMLSAGKGASEYSLDTGRKRHFLLSRWTFRPSAGLHAAEKTVDWNWKWSVIGKVELMTQCTIPADWKEREVCFLAEGGIDDLAEVWFNGSLLGRVTRDQSRYWERPHRYRIAPELIRFDRPNTIRIVAENLRGTGGFGKCPELAAVTENVSSRKLTIDRTNWIGKGGILSDSSGVLWRFDSSLAFPGIRWEVFTPEVSMALSNIADYAAYRKDGKIHIADLRRMETVETSWDEPWLLLFRDGREFPLLLVFSRKMEYIGCDKTDGQVTGLCLRRKNGVGMIVPVWISGSSRTDSRHWKNGLPDGVVRAIGAWYPKAFRYPVDCRESFRLDGDRIAVRSSWSYRNTESDWIVKSAPFAPVSPLAWQMRGTLTAMKNVQGTGLITSIGEFALAENSDTAYWSLPLPCVAPLFRCPGIRDDSGAAETANRVFGNGVRWSAGGRTAFHAWTPRYPMGKDFPECANVSLHAWTMGINQLLGNPFLLTPENRMRFMERIRIRYFEPIERFQQKAANRWREEPFSGIRYPVYFSSFYPHSTRYAGNSGTVLDYGDQNETAFMILSIARQLADLYGQKEFVRANWHFLKRCAACFPLVSDDWGYMACHCRESGGGAMIDMLNCEYAGMMNLARLAEIAGDERMRSQALYRAARRMVPTLARLTFLPFAKRHGLEAYPDNLAFCVGFKEEGAAYRAKGVPPKEIDLFDMSQGTPEELVALYRQYAPEAVQPYLSVVRDCLQRTPSARNASMADILARSRKVAPEELRGILTGILKEDATLKQLGSDWPGMTLPAYVNTLLAEIHSAPRIRNAVLLKMNDAVYDPADRTLRIQAEVDPESRLALELRQTDSVTVNGRRVVPDRNGYVPLAIGHNEIILKRERME